MTVQTNETSLAVGQLGAAPVDPATSKYLTFSLGSEEFGIQVLRVKEMMGAQKIIEISGRPWNLKGALNVRGKNIPVLDLRLKMAMPDAPFTQTTCILVVQVIQEREPATIGLIVDGVSEVLNLDAADIEDASDLTGGAEMPFVQGIARCKGAVKILKIDDVLTLQELRGMSDSIH